MRLPFRNFPVDLNIGRFYLREIAITNWVTSLKLDTNRVVISPLQLTVNGASVKGNVDLNIGVPGYDYNVSLTGDRIPLEPLANSFMPDKRGMYQGQLLFDTQVKGAGTTGASLQKSLAGQFSFSFTNANVQIVSPKLKQFLQEVVLFLGIPELSSSPLNWVDVRTEMGKGGIDFKN